jgi:hypothetical protein
MCTDPFDVIGGNKCATLGNPVAVDADGLLVDVDVQSINDNPPTREDKRQDVDYFFRTAVVKDVNGKSKKYRACKLCPCALAWPFCHHLCTDMGFLGTIRVLSMKSQRYVAISRQIIQ